MGVCECRAWVSSNSGHSLALEGVEDGDVKSCIASLVPVGDQDVCWPSVVAREEGLLLLDMVEDRGGSHAVDVVVLVVVSGDPLSP